jgi:hypothetical protein
MKTEQEKALEFQREDCWGHSTKELDLEDSMVHPMAGCCAMEHQWVRVTEQEILFP